MSVEDADRIAGDGDRIELLDGRVLTLHYGFGGLRRIEKNFGGLRALFEGIGDPLGPKFYDGLLHGLHAGLWKTNITESELEESLDPTESFTYAEALSNALMEAFPKQAREAIEEARREREMTTSPSPGDDGITSRPSDTVEPESSSGA